MFVCNHSMVWAIFFGSLFYHVSFEHFPILIWYSSPIFKGCVSSLVAFPAKISLFQYFPNFTRLCGKALKPQKNSVDFWKTVLTNYDVYFLNPLQWLASALGEPFLPYIDLFMCFLRQKIIKRYIHLLARNINKSFWISLKESHTFRLTKHRKGKLTC